LVVILLIHIVKASIKDKGKKPEGTINLSDAHKRILSQLKPEEKKEEEKKVVTHEQIQKDDFRVAPKEFIKLRRETKRHNVFTEGKTAPSATSTALSLNTDNKYRALTLDEIQTEYYQIVKSRQLKGYAKIQTNLGPLNFEVYSHLAPKAAENFLELLENGYYHHTRFHRLIPGFMVQGGDPEGSGRGGDSYLGGTFADEFTDKLTHDSRGLLSMANSGPNTNRSQL
jgi:peptidyl-prolyl cis-trans isomerase-like protein 2